MVSRQGDDALDVAFFRVAGVVEDDDVATLDGGKAIDKLVDEEAVAVFQAGQHGGAFDADRLIENEDDEYHYATNEKVTQPQVSEASAGCWSWFGHGIVGRFERLFRLAGRGDR
jgi:hypothetical protein